jgi:hypothetical protein
MDTSPREDLTYGLTAKNKKYRDLSEGKNNGTLRRRSPYCNDV